MLKRLFVLLLYMFPATAIDMTGRMGDKLTTAEAVKDGNDFVRTLGEGLTNPESEKNLLKNFDPQMNRTIENVHTAAKKFVDDEIGGDERLTSGDSGKGPAAFAKQIIQFGKCLDDIQTYLTRGENEIQGSPAEKQKTLTLQANLLKVITELNQKLSEDEKTKEYYEKAVSKGNSSGQCGYGHVLEALQEDANVKIAEMQQKLAELTKDLEEDMKGDSHFRASDLKEYLSGVEEILQKFQQDMEERKKSGDAVAQLYTSSAQKLDAIAKEYYDVKETLEFPEVKMQMGDLEPIFASIQGLLEKDYTSPGFGEVWSHPELQGEAFGIATAIDVIPLMVLTFATALTFISNWLRRRMGEKNKFRDFGTIFAELERDCIDPLVETLQKFISGPLKLIVSENIPLFSDEQIRDAIFRYLTQINPNLLRALDSTEKAPFHKRAGSFMRETLTADDSFQEQKILDQLVLALNKAHNDPESFYGIIEILMPGFKNPKKINTVREFYLSMSKSGNTEKDERYQKIADISFQNASDMICQDIAKKMSSFKNQIDQALIILSPSENPGEAFSQEAQDRAKKLVELSDIIFEILKQEGEESTKKYSRIKGPYQEFLKLVEGFPAPDVLEGIRAREKSKKEAEERERERQRLEQEKIEENKKQQRLRKMEKKLSRIAAAGEFDPGEAEMKTAILSHSNKSDDRDLDDLDDDAPFDFSSELEEPKSETNTKLVLDDNLVSLELKDTGIVESKDAEISEPAVEFSDLTDMDEIETKLDLAKAYIDMEEESARGILSEILIEGNDEQKSEAKALIDLLSEKKSKKSS